MKNTFYAFHNKEMKVKRTFSKYYHAKLFKWKKYIAFNLEVIWKIPLCETLHWSQSIFYMRHSKLTGKENKLYVFAISFLLKSERNSTRMTTDFLIHDFKSLMVGLCLNIAGEVRKVTGNLLFLISWLSFFLSF